MLTCKLYCRETKEDHLFYNKFYCKECFKLYLKSKEYKRKSRAKKRPEKAIEKICSQCGFLGFIDCGAGENDFYKSSAKYYKSECKACSKKYYKANKKKYKHAYDKEQYYKIIEQKLINGESYSPKVKEYQDYVILHYPDRKEDILKIMAKQRLNYIRQLKRIKPLTE